MGASALAALWLLYRLGGESALLSGATGALLLIACLRWYGDNQRSKANGIWALAAIGLLCAFWIWRVDRPSAQPSAGVSVSGWSEAAVGRELAAGHPVFVYFTADWCLTCKANEAGAIDRDEVRAAFRKTGVKVLAGDWTNGDPAITRFLEAHGRAGVPLYLWYAPGKPPEELPQILTPSMLISRAQSAKG
jgi:thiol:disulfide interchange protein